MIGQISNHSISLLRVQIVTLVTSVHNLVDVITSSRGEHLEKRQRVWSGTNVFACLNADSVDADFNNSKQAVR